MILMHPMERETACRVVLDKDVHEDKISQEEWATVRERWRQLDYCYCLECHRQFQLDWEEDKKVCPECGFINVTTIRMMLGFSCPLCKNGYIIAEDTGIVS